MKDTDAYQKAKKRAEEKMGFYRHLSVYIAVNLLLAVINFTTSTQSLWFQWPLLGWGIGVTLHALAVFVFPNRLALTEKMIEREINKQK